MAEKYNFAAETQQLLDIVIHSLYKEKEVFIRELISNASDSCEKVRFMQSAGISVIEQEKPLQISISTDEIKKTFTIEDTGVGMTKSELIENLGTIAQSGTKAFLKQIQEDKKANADLIGRFGVGFYSAFMVAKKITVLTKSYKPDEKGYRWVSEGAGGFEIEEYPEAERGTKIIIELKEEAAEYSKSTVVEPIIKRYSNFVQFPIELNGKRINVIQAIWLKNKNEVKEEEYNEFYQYISRDFEPPLLKFHLHCDAPLSVHALLFVPKHNPEAYGLGRFEASVNIYCKKVLVQAKSKEILPEWLRFLKGVVDSEDLPLNISREFVQDSLLIMRLKRILTNRFIKFLEEIAKNEQTTYQTFYDNFGRFLKEGIINEVEYRATLAEFLRYESSAIEQGKMTSLADYAKRMKPDQKEIYYLLAENRRSAEESPFLEAFKSRNIEVLFLYDPWDEFVMETLREYDKKQIKSIERTEIESAETDKTGLTDEEAKQLANWVKQVLKDRVGQVKVSKRLVKSPALATDSNKFISASLHRYLKTISPEKNFTESLIPDIEINPHHPLIIKLNEIRQKNEELATMLAGHIVDAGLLAGGLTDNPQPAIERLHNLLIKILNEKNG